MAQTMQRPIPTIGPHPEQHRPWWELALVTLVGLAVGLLGGWWAASAMHDDSAVVVAGGGDQTATQQQMLHVLTDYQDAWVAGDADAVAALFAPDGYIAWSNGEVSRVSDGSLYAAVDSMETLQILEPQVLSDNTVASVASLGPDGVYGTTTDVFRFTTESPPLIISQTQVGH